MVGVAKLRLWLLNIVREAVRVELAAYSNPLLARGGGKFQVAKPEEILPIPPMPNAQQRAGAAASHPESVSFEQLQSEAIEEQEKFYAPAPR